MFNIRKSKVEIYCAVKEDVLSDIRRIKADYDIPFICFYVDLFTSKTSNQKYVAIRIGYMQRSGFLGGHNIAVRAYSPCADDLESQAASELLVKWCGAIAAEFEIDIHKDCLTSSSDSGPDVRRALDTLVPVMREWCISHWMHRALMESFGTSIDKRQSKNLRARAVFDRLRKTVERINKSTHTKARFEEAVQEEFGRFLKLSNAPGHRWASVEGVLRRVLQLWAQLQAACINQTFDLQNDHVLLIEFRSCLHPARRIQELAQSTKSFVAVDVYVMLCALLFGVLDSTTSLTIIDDKPHRIDGTIRQPEERHPSELHELTTDVRDKMLISMSKRYFNRYHPIYSLRNWKQFYGTHAFKSATNYDPSDFKFSYGLDIQSVLHPRMSDGSVLKRMIEKMYIDDSDIPDGWSVENLRRSHFDIVFSLVWSTIEKLALIIATAHHRDHDDAGHLDDPAPAAIRSTKKRRLASDESNSDVLDMLCSRPVQRDNRDQSSSSSRSPTDIVADEIKRFREISDNSALALAASKLPAWFAQKAQRAAFPCLSQVAHALFGMMPSAGGLECDLGSMADILSLKRASLGPGYVEIDMFLRLNKHRIPTNPDNVPPLRNDEWKNRIPSRPAFDDDCDASESECDSDSILIVE